MLKFKNDFQKILSEINHKNLFLQNQRAESNLRGLSEQEIQRRNEKYYNNRKNIDNEVNKVYEMVINGPLNILIHDEDMDDLYFYKASGDEAKDSFGVKQYFIKNSSDEIICKLDILDLFDRDIYKNIPILKYVYTKEDVESSNILNKGFDESLFYKNKLKSKFDNFMFAQQKNAILKLCDITKHVNLGLMFNVEMAGKTEDYHFPKVLIPEISMFVIGNSYPKTSIISEIYNEDPYQMLFISLHEHMKVKFGVNDHTELKSIIENTEEINKVLKDNNINTIGFEISEKSHLYTKSYGCIIIKDTVFDKKVELIIPFENEINIESLLKNKMHLIVNYKDSKSDYSATLSEYMEHPKEILEYIYLNGY